MKFRTLLVPAIVIAFVLALAACDQLLGGFPLNDEERAQAFIASANRSPQDPDAMQSHFHPTDVQEYSTMTTVEYWSNTFFSASDQPFTVNDLVEGNGVNGYDGTTSLTGTITSGEVTTPVPIEFGFLADPDNPGNRLLRVIIVNEDTELIHNVR